MHSFIHSFLNIILIGINMNGIGCKNDDCKYSHDPSIIISLTLFKYHSFMVADLCCLIVSDEAREKLRAEVAGAAERKKDTNTTTTTPIGSNSNVSSKTTPSTNGAPSSNVPSSSVAASSSSLSSMPPITPTPVRLSVKDQMARDKAEALATAQLARETAILEPDANIFASVFSDSHNKDDHDDNDNGINTQLVQSISMLI
jgi:hypothetical protein